MIGDNRKRNHRHQRRQTDILQQPIQFPFRTHRSNEIQYSRQKIAQLKTCRINQQRIIKNSNHHRKREGIFRFNPMAGDFSHQKDKMRADSSEDTDSPPGQHTISDQKNDQQLICSLMADFHPQKDIAHLRQQQLDMHAGNRKKMQ